MGGAINNCKHRQALSRLLAIAILATALGCESMAGKGMVQSPNHGRTVAQVNIPLKPDDPSDMKLRVEIEPGVSLAVRIAQPNAVLLAAADDPNNQTLTDASDQSFAAMARDLSKPRGTIFILHGMRGHTSTKTFYHWASYLTESGYQAILVDLRGHGRSTGDWITFGAHEATDLVHITNHLQNRKLIDGPIGVMGISYGGTTAIKWASIDPRVKAVVALEPYDNMHQIVREVGQRHFTLMFLFSGPDVWDRITRKAGQTANFDPHQADALTAASSMQTPILLIHGLDDDHVLPDHSRRIAQAAAGPNRLVLIPGENHDSLPSGAKRQIELETKIWLNQWLNNAPD